MSIIRGNILTKGLSGMLGGVVVYRQLRGKTVMSNRPRKPTRQSDLQRQNRQRFRAAALFAREAMQDPEKKERYRIKARKLNLPNAYTAALTDYLRKPSVNTIKCKGRAGNLMTIQASKKGFALASVEVALTDAQGTLLATHTASLKDRGRNEWVVQLPPALLPLKDTPDHEHRCNVVVMAKDYAGNVTYKAAA